MSFRAYRELVFLRRLCLERGLKWTECTTADVYPLLCEFVEQRTPDEDLALAEGLVKSGLLKEISEDGTTI